LEDHISGYVFFELHIQQSVTVTWL